MDCIQAEDEHNKHACLFTDSDGGGVYFEEIYYSLDYQKRCADQKLLKGHRCSKL